jgi:thiosulfate reductase/polysulfide reductase chain A
MTEKKEGVMQTPISRRTFAKIMGAAGAAAGLGGGAAKMFVAADEAAAAVTVNNAIGACKICGSECSYIAKKTADGHFELFGQPESPTDNIWGDGKGRLCVKGYAGPDKALNPDRIYYPMKRTNPKKGPNEDPGFVRITWQEAYQIAAKKLNETVAQYGSKSVAIISRANDWTRRFMSALGTPNQMGHHSTCFTTHTWAWPALVPQVSKGGRSWTHDYGNSTYLLSFGHDQVGRAQNPTVQGVIKALETGPR